MSIHKITVDVYGSWSTTPPRYRVYVDNELLTERDFIWPGHEICIEENIYVDIESGPHKLTIEQVSNHGVIKHKNVTVDDVASLDEFVTSE